jgi:hypothetical protein
MIVGFITTCTYIFSAYYHLHCDFEPYSWSGLLDTTLCDKVDQWLAAGQWFSPGTPVSSTNITEGHDITKILLKVALNTITKPNLIGHVYQGNLNHTFLLYRNHRTI